MKKYRKIDAVLVTQWTGDESIISDVKENLDRINKESKWAEWGNKFDIGKCDGDDNVLYLHHDHGDGSSSNIFVYLNDYIVLDLDEDVYPLSCCHEDYLNSTYVEL